uniref:Protein kinase domain-containing protein n=1 Tax=Meloidogyne incognita TaxID=6306 RepID=A0A914NS02_MELIC
MYIGGIVVEDRGILTKIKKNIKNEVRDFNTSVITSNAEISTKVHGLKKFRAPEIRGENPQGFKVNRKVDIWAFGLMIYGLYKKKGDEEQPNDRELINSVRMSLGDYTELDNELREYLSNTESNSFLDRVIKGCLQLEVDIRPSINAIVDFLNEECNGFEYEREFLNNEDIKWCNEN